jgi:hypothetical protein
MDTDDDNTRNIYKKSIKIIIQVSIPLGYTRGEYKDPRFCATKFFYIAFNNSRQCGLKYFWDGSIKVRHFDYVWVEQILFYKLQSNAAL